MYGLTNFGSHSRRRVEVLAGHVHLSLSRLQHPQLVPGGGVFRIHLDGLFEVVLGIVEFLFLEGVQPLVVGLLGVLRRRQRDRADRLALFGRPVAMQQNRAYVRDRPSNAAPTTAPSASDSPQLGLQVAAHVLALVRLELPSRPAVPVPPIMPGVRPAARTEFAGVLDHPVARAQLDREVALGVRIAFAVRRAVTHGFDDHRFRRRGSVLQHHAAADEDGLRDADRRRVCRVGGGRGGRRGAPRAVCPPVLPVVPPVPVVGGRVTSRLCFGR